MTAIAVLLTAAVLVSVFVSPSFGAGSKVRVRIVGANNGKDVTDGGVAGHTFVVKIDTGTGSSRWTITSATKRYKGLHGAGTETENAAHTVSVLTGTVSR